MKQQPVAQRRCPDVLPAPLAPRAGSGPITAAQIEQARLLLKWWPSRLAKQAKLSIDTVRRLQRQGGEHHVTTASLTAIRLAFEAAGVEFSDRGAERGVRLKPPPSGRAP